MDRVHTNLVCTGFILVFLINFMILTSNIATNNHARIWYIYAVRNLELQNMPCEFATKKSQHHTDVIKRDEELAHVVEHSPLILEVRGSILTPSIMLGYFLSMLCMLYQPMCW